MIGLQGGIALAARQRYAQSPAGWRELLETDLEVLAGRQSAILDALWPLLAEGGRLVDVPVLDHLIVSARGYYSFADEGLI